MTTTVPVPGASASSEPMPPVYHPAPNYPPTTPPYGYNAPSAPAAPAKQPTAGWPWFWFVVLGGLVFPVAIASSIQAKRARQLSRPTLRYWIPTYLSVAALVIVVAGIVLLPTGGSGNKPGNTAPSIKLNSSLNSSAVANTIEQQANGLFTNVSCPSMQEKVGQTYTCTADGGKKITVQIVGANGQFTWVPQ